jgi:hypothetical protein
MANQSNQAEMGRSAIRAAPGQPMWVVLNHVKADHRANFEQFVHQILKPMAAQTAPEQFRQFRVLHPASPNSDGTYTYVFLMDPLVIGGDYSFDGLKHMYGEEQAQIYLQIWDNALASPQVGYEVVQSEW